MSISISLPNNPEKLSGIENIGKFLFTGNALPNRKIVFFDESVTGYIIYKDNKEKQKNIQSEVYLDVFILPGDILENKDAEAYAKSKQNEENNDYFNGDNFSIFNTTLTSDDVVFDELNTLDDSSYIVWKFEIPVTYPRKKFSNPKILLSCLFERNENKTVALDENRLQAENDKILVDYQPGYNRNLLSELNNQVSLSSSNDNKNYQLSNSIIEKKTESYKKGAKLEQTNNHTNKGLILKADLSIPVSVSLVIRLKSTKSAGRNDVLLATLNLESSEELIKFLNDEEEIYYFNILHLSMDFKSGKIEEFKSNKFPISFRLIDSINLTYKLSNNEFHDKELKNLDNSNYQFSKPINIKLILQVQKFIPLMNIFQNISNVITTSWSPFLDFSIIAPPINNSLKTTTNYSQVQSQPVIPSQAKNISTRKSALMNSIYKVKSPNIINSGSTSVTSLSYPIAVNGNAPKKLNKSIISSSSSVTVNVTTNNNSTLSGLKLTFRGKLNIKLGEVINWKVQAINNSPNKLNLSLIVQNPINFTPMNQSNSAFSNNFSSSNLLKSDNSDNSNDVLVYNQLQLYSLYNSLKLNINGIVILNNEIRIGPLDLNTVFETNIKLVGITKGIFNLDGIKIFDINSGDGLDFGKLVEVFVI